ncbi:pentapeptide repeat-containing protein [Nocardia amamiensis]|uniref:Pentapeptide repeat-containing protein n=1 Tax=Nocardia amamiensis TaxID=404578 RepID=A0ABS0CVK8_9NOCA|nr:pentapeptide repeat-containing protein [Nocardia amamiensis]MBF6298828.1 pentapeptide repeat-containing protein [Nocardia amamiensis]
MTTTVAAIAALWFTSQSLRATDNQYNLSRQVAVTDRFQKAVDQLTSDKIDIRLGGIYLLERLAKDSPADHPTIFAVLSAFLRTHTSASACDTPTPATPAPVDVQAVLTVIGTREASRDDHRRTFDLRRTCLSGMQLNAANLTRTELRYANLTQADLAFANLVGVQFDGANLTRAHLGGADVSCAKDSDGVWSCASLDEANLTEAHLADAHLTAATFVRANLADADLARANLTDANLLGANLTGANLVGADLTNAQLTDRFTGTGTLDANLTDIYYDHATRWPDGFTPPKSRPSVERR